MIREFAKKYVRFRMYFNRGMSYVGDFKQLFYFAIGFKLFGLSSAWSAALAAACGIIVLLMGIYDIHNLKIMQFENRLLTKYNPIFSEIHNASIRSGERNKRLPRKMGK